MNEEKHEKVEKVKTSAKNIRETNVIILEHILDFQIFYHSLLFGIKKLLKNRNLPIFCPDSGRRK